MRDLRADDPLRIGDYALLGLLGRGGMGSVYLGRSRGGRTLAIKLVRPELVAEPEFRERFRREIGMAREVGGFWTAAVVDADPDADRPWLATEYIPGPSLHEAVITAGALPEPSALRLAAGLTEAVAAIHGAGLVHRDLKPSNVLLANDGPRVIDFGIAHAAEHGTLTTPGEFFGTPGFLAPEQISGDPVGPPADVYALGSVLVFAVTGTGPLGDGPTPALLHRAVHGDPELSAVPDAVRALAAACLHRDPARRPTPAELLDHVTGQRIPPSTRWLPARVETLVDRRRTALYTLLDSPASPADTRTDTDTPSALPGTRSAEITPHTAPDTRADSVIADATPGTQNDAVTPKTAPGAQLPLARDQGGEVPDTARFQTSRVRAVLWAAAFGVGAIMVSGLGNPLFPPPVRLTGAVATTTCCVLAALLLIGAARPRRVVEVNADGLVVRRGRRHWRFGWATIARTRIVDGRRTSLVLWPANGAAAPGIGTFPQRHGGLHVYPVRGSRRRRRREVRELRAALGWYGRASYDPAP